MTNGLQELAQTLQVLVSLQDYSNYLTSLSLQALSQLSYYSLQELPSSMGAYIYTRATSTPWVLISLRATPTPFLFLSLHDQPQLHGHSYLSKGYSNILIALIILRAIPTPSVLFSHQDLHQPSQCSYLIRLRGRDGVEHHGLEPSLYPFLFLFRVLFTVHSQQICY